MRKEISRRDFLKSISLTAATVTIAGYSNISARTIGKKRDKKPNIILFISDDHGWAYSGCYGNRTVKTPNLDRLASRGMRFTNAFAGSPTCVPSRSVVYTGLMPFRNGAHPNHSRIRSGIQTLPHYMKPLGYRVALANKGHVKPRSDFPFEYVKATLPPDPTFKRKYRKEGIDTDAVDQFLADHAENHPGQPLCLVLGASSPHVNWRPGSTYDLQKVRLPPYLVDTAETRSAMTRYYTEITLMDTRLGQCLKSIKKYGFEKNTIFIYISDQGAEWPHAKWNLYDAGIRVPMLIRWPGKVTPASVCKAMISLADLLPTFIELAGARPPTDIDGRSFLSVILGKANQHRQHIFAAHTGDGNKNDYPCRCIRTLTHKYIINLKYQTTWSTHFTKVIDPDHGEIWQSWLKKARTDKHAAELIQKLRHRAAEELYDLRTDPHELNNIADEPGNRDLVVSLRRKLTGWMRQQADPWVDELERT